MSWVEPRWARTLLLSTPTRQFPGWRSVLIGLIFFILNSWKLFLMMFVVMKQQSEVTRLRFFWLNQEQEFKRLLQKMKGSKKFQVTSIVEHNI